MSDETRSKISAAQKLRYKHDPALKAAMRLKLVVRARHRASGWVDPAKPAELKEGHLCASPQLAR